MKRALANHAATENPQLATENPLVDPYGKGILPAGTALHDL